MSDTIATDEATGVTLSIEVDPCPSDVASPADDDAFIMAVLHRNLINPAADKGLTSQEAIEQFELACHEGREPYKAFPLFMFDHSSQTYKVGEPVAPGERPANPFGDGMYAQFDSGRLGTLFVRTGEDGLTDPDAAAKGFCAQYTAWANGEVYFYVVTDGDGHVLDSHGGYIGEDGYKAAEEDGRDDFDGHVAEAAAKLKAEQEARDTAYPLNPAQQAMLKVYGGGDYAYLADKAALSLDEMDNLGDTLLRFLVIELSTKEGCDEDGAAARVMSAINDLQTVHHALAFG